MTGRLYRRKSRGSKEARHVRLYHSMLKSPAWKSLDAVARALYIEITARYGGPGSNNGRIPYSVREGATALRIGKTKSALGLQMLQDRGFIVAMTLGGFNRKDRHATEWLLTEFPNDLSQGYEMPKRTYESWKPDAKIQNALPTSGLTVPTSGVSGTHKRTIAA
jgi:hypothetical protein